MRVPVCAAAILALAATSTGCGSDGTPAAPANTIDYQSFGTSASIDCANGKSLTVGGSNNTLTVTGTCGSVSIGGADNTVKLNRVDDELSIVGLNNTVTYRAGDPKVHDEGTGNRVNGG